MGSYVGFTKNVYGCRQTDRQTETETHTHTHTHTHTWLAGVQHIGHILVVSIILEAQLLHTHKCAQGKNKCDCMLAHH